MAVSLWEDRDTVIHPTVSCFSSWGDHGEAQAWVLCGKGVSAQHWVTLSLVALAGPSLQGHISCWWLDTKWSVAVLTAIIAGDRDLPTVGPFGASLRNSF